MKVGSIKLSVLLSVIMIIYLAARGPGWAQEVQPEAKVTYLFSGDAGYPPYQYLDEEGRPTGFNVDLLREISRIMNFEVEIELMNWSDARQALDEGRIDGLTGMFYSLERDRVYDFSVPHSTVQYVIFTRSGEDEGLHDTHDLTGREVIYQRGDIIEDWLDETGLDVIRVPVETPAAGLRRLAAGENDCALLARLPALYLLKQLGIDNVIAAGDIHMAQDYCFAVNPENDRLLQMLNEGLKTVMTTGEYEVIANRWFGRMDTGPIMFEYAARVTGMVLGLLLVLLLISMLWTWTLRREVRRGTIKLKRELAERKRVEAALRNSQAQMQAITDNTLANVSLCDREGRLIMVNRQMEKTCAEVGLASPQGLLLEEVFPPDIARTMSENNNAVFESGQSMHFEETFFMGGEERTFIAVKVPLPDEKGEPYAVCCVATDITEMKKTEREQRHMEAQMREAQKMESLGVLAGGIAHDFNNLLMGVLGYSDLLADELPKDSPLQRYLHQIELASHRAADLCTQMLAYAGKGKFKIQVFCLSSLIDEMADLIRLSISRKAHLELIRGDEAALIEADASQIRQVVLNLIINASEALGEDGGNITVRTSVAGETSVCDMLAELPPEGRGRKHVMLDVSDDGVGMEEGLCDKIFEPFFSTKFTGRGLGLAAVQGIVKSHYGVIKVKSRPAEGTTFRVLLPMASREILPAAPSPPDKQPAEIWHGEGKVLVVDDEKVVMDVATMALSMAGLTVLKAMDGEEAVQQVADNPGEIGLVLLDLTMPGMSGMETLKILRDIEPELRVLLTSGYSEEEASNQLHGQTIFGFIQKPYRPTELIEKVRIALEERESRRS